MTFLKHWKQKNAEITHQWDLMEFEEEEVRIFDVAEYEHLVTLIRIDLDLNLPYVHLE